MASKKRSRASDSESDASQESQAKRTMQDNSTSGSVTYSAKVKESGTKPFMTPKLYDEWYAKSISDPESFWGDLGRSELSWHHAFDRAVSGDFRSGNIAWFLNGQINVCYNCVDRHLPQRANQTAILWEGDHPTHVRRVTYQELFEDVCRIANLLRRYGIRRGDHVAIYMPMVPEVIAAMLACSRIGAPHVAVFAGFSAESLKQRILDTRSRIVLTADGFTRGNRRIVLKPIVDEAIQGCDCVELVFVQNSLGQAAADGNVSTGGIPLPSTIRSLPSTPQCNMTSPRDVDLLAAMRLERPYAPIEFVDSEHPLYVLHTSGSTGKPKGLVHTTAGYLLYSAITAKISFDIHSDGKDILGCVADVGWVTGHTYIVYGPLCLGATTFMFMGLPTYPDYSRYWDMVERHSLTHLYMSPTAVRTLMAKGDDPVKPYAMNSLRVVGVVGEPTNPKAWEWVYHVVGRGRASIVDTYFQTETGGHMMLPLPYVAPMRPGAASFPFFGIDPVLINPETREEIPYPRRKMGDGDADLVGQKEVSGHLAIRSPWPSIARTVLGDHQRYLETYLSQYPGYYFTGDGATVDKDGYLWITGRVDDVINKSGHRLGSAEIESALVAHPACAEAAVIAIPDDVRGEAIAAYCILASGYESHTKEMLLTELKESVRKHIGSLAVPDIIVLTPGLPKTRSGKIMRRILRKLLDGSFNGDVSVFGDTTALNDPSVIDILVQKVAEFRRK